MLTALYFVFKTALTGTCGAPWVPATRRTDVVRSQRCQVLAYVCLCLASVWFSSSLLLRCWLLPLAVGQPILWGQFIAQHTGTDFRSEQSIELDPRTSLASHDVEGLHSRTTLTWPWYAWLSWYMPYHAVHHAYPTIPFFNLPAAHELQAKAMRHVQPSGYLSVHLGIIRGHISSKVETVAWK